MLRHGCAALLAAACFIAAPAAHAGDFFVGAQYGQAYMPDQGFKDDTTSTAGVNVGYLWHPLPLLKVGVEASANRLGDIDESDDFGHWRMQGDYAGIGANARFRFGPSPAFAVARAGYVVYDRKLDYRDYYDATYDGSWSEDDGGAYYGVGVGVDFSPLTNLQLMYNVAVLPQVYQDGNGDYYWDGSDTAQSLTLGLEVQF